MEQRTQRFLQHLGREKVSQDKIDEIVKAQENFESLRRQGRKMVTKDGKETTFYKMTPEYQQRLKMAKKRLKKAKKIAKEVEKEYEDNIQAAIRNGTIPPPEEDDFVKHCKKKTREAGKEKGTECEL